MAPKDTPHYVCIYMYIYVYVHFLYVYASILYVFFTNLGETYS